MPKGAVVGGPSIVFTRYHEVGVTMIRDHQIENPRIWKNILGYDANALYLSTMLREMPCEKERVVHYTQRKDEAARRLVQRLKDGAWFGFAEVDIETPEALRPKFEEMRPFFYNKEFPAKAVPKRMADYLERTGRTRGNGKSWWGLCPRRSCWCTPPLLRWYVDHGAVNKAVHRTIDYQAGEIFPWFVEQVTEAWRTGDVEKSKALLAEVFKLLGDSCYGKLIEALERQTNVIYTKDKKVVERASQSAYFSDLDELGQAYKLESKKPRITIRRPLQIGIAVYQLAKLRMFEFYYDFLDRYFDRRDFVLIQTDTDSNYKAISADSLEEIVRPELRTEFEVKKKEWLAWDKWNGHTQGLFKLECEGSRMIALCSKCYFIDERDSEKKKWSERKMIALCSRCYFIYELDGEKKKFITKGMSKRQNEVNWLRFKAALEGLATT